MASGGHDRFHRDDRQRGQVEQPSYLEQFSHVEQLWPVQRPGCEQHQLAACGRDLSVGAASLLAGHWARVYQGLLVVGVTGQTDNVVPLEDYVDGVAAAESPPMWANTGGEAALQAQAVAARSVAVALVSLTGSICDTTQCQVYKGLPEQYGMTADKAVSSTAGEVLYCVAGSSCGPAGSVAVTEYSASTGGYSAGGAFPAVPDLGDSVSANPVHSWTMRIPLSRIEAAFPKVGAVQQVQVTQRNGLGQLGGRVEELQVVGSEGSVGLTGDQFAADFDLYSDWFAVGGAQPEPTTTSTTSPGRPLQPAPRRRAP